MKKRYRVIEFDCGDDCVVAGPMILRDAKKALQEVARHYDDNVELGIHDENPKNGDPIVLRGKAIDLRGGSMACRICGLSTLHTHALPRPKAGLNLGSTKVG